MILDLHSSSTLWITPARQLRWLAGEVKLKHPGMGPCMPSNCFPSACSAEAWPGLDTLSSTLCWQQGWLRRSRAMGSSRFCGSRCTRALACRSLFWPRKACRLDVDNAQEGDHDPGKHDGIDRHANAAAIPCSELLSAQDRSKQGDGWVFKQAKRKHFQ